MKKIFFFAAALLATMSVSAGETLTFNADTLEHKTAGAWSNGYAWEMENFDVTLVDTKGKFKVTANNAYFGTAESYVKLESRLQTGGKTSTSGENSIEIDVYSAGTLAIAARTGSNSATDRNIVVKQGETELLNHILLESEAVQVAMSSEDPTDLTNVYPILTCPVVGGKVIISYPVNGINIYAISLGDGAIETAVDEVEADAPKAQKLMENGQLVIKKGDKKYNALGAEL